MRMKMIGMFGLGKIERLKRKAASHYCKYRDVTTGMSCGNHLAEHISTAASKHKHAFNKLMDGLTLLDSSCQKTRL